MEKVFKAETLVVALGVDTGGYKHVLGLWQGATENAQVCGDLLDDLEKRGLDTENASLFILDGSKALRSAVAKKFGRKALVQRCQKHKRNNIESYLSERHGREIDNRLCDAYAMDSYEEANASLDRTVEQLKRLNPSAAKSLQEGLEETLTLHKLGLSKSLCKSLQTTNVIESCFATTRHLTRNVKRWRDGDMRQRWACTALLEAEKKFRRINGYRKMFQLVQALKAYEASLDFNEDVA